MRKILIISNCCDCSHYVTYGDDDTIFPEDECNEMSRSFSKADKRLDFPLWCPLDTEDEWRDR